MLLQDPKMITLHGDPGIQNLYQINSGWVLLHIKFQMCKRRIVKEQKLKIKGVTVKEEEKTIIT